MQRAVALRINIIAKKFIFAIEAFIAFNKSESSILAYIINQNGFHQIMFAISSTLKLTLSMHGQHFMFYYMQHCELTISTTLFVLGEDHFYSLCLTCSCLTRLKTSEPENSVPAHTHCPIYGGGLARKTVYTYDNCFS